MGNSIQHFTKIWNEDSWGITNSSLMNLRNELCSRYSHKIAVVKVITAEEICGYLIIDNSAKCMVYTGDGFRIDLGGEGGAGYNSAQLLFASLGISVCFEIYIVEELAKLYKNSSIARLSLDIQSLLIGSVNSILEDIEFVDYSTIKPIYIRVNKLQS